MRGKENPMERGVFILGILLLIVGMAACEFSIAGELGIRSADKEYMELLIKELNSSGISYRIDNKGFIRYPKSEKARFDKIQAKVQIMLFKFSPSGGRIHSADPEFMRLMKKELASAGIKHEVDKEGFIVYSMADKGRFESIGKVRENDYVRIKLSDNPEREGLINVLRKEGVDHSIQNREDGVWVKWYPKDKEHKEEIDKKLGIFCPKERKRSCNISQ